VNHRFADLLREKKIPHESGQLTGKSQLAVLGPSGERGFADCGREAKGAVATTTR
jgi:hypothetical protein